MDPYRLYGAAAYTVVLVHGGPGAPGSLAPVARDLSHHWGVVETLHSARTIDGQLGELQAAISAAAHPPVTLIGHSWGAMLTYLFAARYPALVRKLILVGSGVFDDRYAAHIETTRQSRLTSEQRHELAALVERVDTATGGDASTIFTRIGEIYARADAYDPLPHDLCDLPAQPEVFESVWPEAAALRASGTLLAAGHAIECPVVALHGDSDPHPVAGIKEPLAATVHAFRLILLPQCGHEPWIERHARHAFYRVLHEELSV
jgi:pimeloyl-ACP methyl ester carboxylesterase